MSLPAAKKSIAALMETPLSKIDPDTSGQFLDDYFLLTRNEQGHTPQEPKFKDLLHEVELEMQSEVDFSADYDQLLGKHGHRQSEFVKKMTKGRETVPPADEYIENNDIGNKAKNFLLLAKSLRVLGNPNSQALADETKAAGIVAQAPQILDEALTVVYPERPIGPGPNFLGAARAAALGYGVTIAREQLAPAAQLLGGRAYP